MEKCFGLLRLAAMVVALLVFPPLVSSADIAVGTTTEKGVIRSTVNFDSGDAINAISRAIPSCPTMTVTFFQNNASRVTLYETDPDDDTFAEVEASTSVVAYTGTSTVSTTFRPGKQFVRFVVDTAETSGSSSAIVNCINSVASTGGGSGTTTWPSFASIGGSGSPTRAMVVDTTFMAIRNTGAGRDDDGSLSSSGCTTGPNATTDHPCVFTNPALGTIDIAATNSPLPSSMSLLHTDPQLSLLCRDSNTFAHQFGTAFDVPISTTEGDAVPLVLHDVSEDKYRLVMGNSFGMNCENPTSVNLSVNGELLYQPNVADDLQLFMSDQVHADQYGSRLLAQTLLDFSWEDIKPAMLGATNLIPNGDFETSCTGTVAADTPFTRTGTGTFTNRAPRTTDALSGPIVGDGCTWTGAAGTDTVTTPLITAFPGEFYVGSIFISLNAVTANDRSTAIRIIDNGGNNISNVKFWVAGPLTGTIAEAADVIDSGGTGTAGEYLPPERACYGGCIIKFAFQIEAGDTGFEVQLEPDEAYTIHFDELWVRKKLYQDFDRHPLIADGHARIQLLSDSRGSLTGYRLRSALDYMTGFTTQLSGDSRSPYRPGLTLDIAPSLNSWNVSGAALGSYVGANDDDLRYNGTAIFEDLGDAMDETADYCVGFFGVNDMTQGGRPTTALNAGDVGNEHFYFGDQIRGFEMDAERAGCLPILIMDTKHRGDTSVAHCKNDAGGTQNCGIWYNEAWETILHNGIK